MLAKESLAYLGSKHCVLVCRGISDAPFTLKLFAKEFGVGIGALCVILTEEQRRSLNITKDIEEQLVERIREAAKLYAPQVRILLNPGSEAAAKLLCSGRCSSWYRRFYAGRLWGAADPDRNRNDLPEL